MPPCLCAQELLPKSCPSPWPRDLRPSYNEWVQPLARRLTQDQAGPLAGVGAPKVEFTSPASLKGTGTRYRVKREAPVPGKTQFQVLPGPQRQVQHPGAPGPAGEHVQCASRVCGAQQSSALLSSGVPPPSQPAETDGGVGGGGVQQGSSGEADRKHFLGKSDFDRLPFFFSLTFGYVSLFYFAHPCDCTP